MFLTMSIAGQKKEEASRRSQQLTVRNGSLQPTASNGSRQFTVSSHQPTATSQQLTASNGRNTQRTQKPPANSSQPATEAAVHSSQPEAAGHRSQLLPLAVGCRLFAVSFFGRLSASSLSCRLLASSAGFFFPQVDHRDVAGGCLWSNDPEPVLGLVPATEKRSSSLG